MDRLKHLICVPVLALGFASFVPVPASASPPFVLAQFFEHFDEFEEEAEPQAGGPTIDDPALEGLDLESLDGTVERYDPQSRQGLEPDTETGRLPPPQGIPDGGFEMGEVPPAFDPADRPQLLAELYDRLGQAGSPTAAEPITRAIEELWAISGSDTVDLLMSRAAQFANAAETDLSLSILDAIVDIAPGEAEAWYLRAKVNVLAGKPEGALIDLRRALNLDAKHYRAIADLGLLLEQLGAKKEALEAYRRALAVNPFLDDAKAGVDALKREVEGQDI